MSDFAYALSSLNQELNVARYDWRAYQRALTMRWCPDGVKRIYIYRFVNPGHLTLWKPTQDDILAHDWFVVDSTMDVGRQEWT